MSGRPIPGPFSVLFVADFCYCLLYFPDCLFYIRYCLFFFLMLSSTFFCCNLHLERIWGSHLFQCCKITDQCILKTTTFSRGISRIRHAPRSKCAMVYSNLFYLTPAREQREKPPPFTTKDICRSPKFLILWNIPVEVLQIHVWA